MELHPVAQHFYSVSPFSREAAEDLNSVIHTRELPKGHHLLEMGTVSREMHFIRKGLARVYYYHDHLEVTDYFAIDGQFIGAVPSLITGEPSQKAIHLLEPSVVDSFGMEAVEDCLAKHHDLERAVRRTMALALLEEQDRIQSLRFHTARERYERMERIYPGITNRCPLKYIASFIGTTSVSVSRIRAGVQ